MFWAAPANRSDSVAPRRFTDTHCPLPKELLFEEWLYYQNLVPRNWTDPKLLQEVLVWVKVFICKPSYYSHGLVFSVNNSVHGCWSPGSVFHVSNPVSMFRFVWLVLLLPCSAHISLGIRRFTLICTHCFFLWPLLKQNKDSLYIFHSLLNGMDGSINIVTLSVTPQPFYLGT